MTTIPPETPPESNPHTLRVRGHMDAVRAVLAQIPGFQHPFKGARRRINFAGTVDDDFLELMARAIEDSAPLSGAAQITPSEVRELIAFGQAHRAFSSDLRVQADAVDYTVAARRASGVRKVLQAYKIAKTLNTPADQTVLIPHLERIKQLLGRKKLPRVTEPETPRGGAV